MQHSGYGPPRGGGSRPGGGGGGGGAGVSAPRAKVVIHFDPGKDEAELYDTLAEKQALELEIRSNQLRKFFGEVKELYRRFEAATASCSPKEREDFYTAQIAPLFRMMRSKVAYARRTGGQSPLPAGFADFLDAAIGKVHNDGDFVRFVRHFEAVVGFMYGNGKVK